MKTDRTGRRDSAETRRLRRVAEEPSQGKPLGTAEEPPPEDVPRLIHELQVHQIELETQNEELRRAHAELEAARDAAQRADRAKSSFLANMSHEIRTPMSGVVGMLHLLRETPLDEAQRRLAELATASAHQLLHLIDDILDLSKVEAGRLEFESVAFSPRRVVEEATSGLAPLAQAKGIGLTCRVDEGVPHVLLGDPHRLRQILVNLMGNAVKFTERGEVEVSLSTAGTLGCQDTGTPACSGGGCPGVSAPRHPGRARLTFTVRDTGIGIPARHRDRLFLNFSQVDGSTARAYGGTGLGLAISKQLVERMGGTIRVQSQEGKGSVFAFVLPFAAAGADPRAPEATAAPLGERPAAIPRRVRILVAEDEPVNREVAVTYLQRRGWQVTTVSDGKAALNALSSEPFDLVLMDVQMPEVDGLEATRRIREQEGSGAGRVPIIGLTAHALKGDREKCLDAGMDDYLVKPIEPQTLYAAVERWVRGPSSPRPPQETPEADALAFLDPRLTNDQKAGLRSSLIKSLADGLLGLKTALLGEDLDEIAFWAHRLRGALVVFRFPDAAKLAEEIETRAAASRRRGLSALVAALEQEVEQVEALLAGSPSP